MMAAHKSRKRQASTAGNSGDAGAGADPGADASDAALLIDSGDGENDTVSNAAVGHGAGDTSNSGGGDLAPSTVGTIHNGSRTDFNSPLHSGLDSSSTDDSAHPSLEVGNIDKIGTASENHTGPHYTDRSYCEDLRLLHSSVSRLCNEVDVIYSLLKDADQVLLGCVVGSGHSADSY